MKRTYIDIRDSEQVRKIVKTLIFKGDVSVIIIAKNRFMVIEHEEKHRSETYEIKETETFNVRNWGN